MIQIKSATGGGKPQTASAVLHNAVYIVVAETTGYFRVVTIVGEQVGIETVAVYTFARRGNP